MTLFELARRAAASSALRGSRLRVHLAHGSDVFVLNPRTMGATVVDRATADALDRRPLALPPEAQPLLVRLRRLGLVVEETAREEEPLAAQLRRPTWATPGVDATLLCEPGMPPAPGVEAVRRLIDDTRRRGPVLMVKFRVCGRKGGVMDQRIEALSSIRDTARQHGLQIGVGFGTDRLAEVGEVEPAATDAFFVCWDLSKRGARAAEEASPAGWAEILDRVGRGAYVAASIAARNQADIDHHRESIVRLARDPRAKQIKWVVAPAPLGPWGYLLTTTCFTAPETMAWLLRLRRALGELGLRPRPVFNGLHVHSGCPMLAPGSWLVDSAGNQRRCAAAVARGRCHTWAGVARRTTARFEPAPNSAARLEQQLAGECRHCWALAFCARRCPGLPAPVPESEECQGFRRSVRYDLETSLLTGQLVPTDPPAGVGRRPAGPGPRSPSSP